MAIKEKPKDIEFTYEDDVGRIIYDIKFSEESETVTIRGFEGQAPTHVILDVKALVEIVDFLRGHKVIDGAQPQSEHPSLSYPPGVRGGSLPLPVIETKDGAVSEDAETPPPGPRGALVPNAPVPEGTIPVPSFEITPSEIPSPTPQVINQATGPVIVNNGNVDTSSIPKRNVIRTRVKDVNDPLAAERDAEAQRKKNPKKTIKRKVDDGV
jgi:hypothetical protein